MAQVSRAKRPFTPMVRRFLRDVFKPAPTDTTLLGKRGRDEDDIEVQNPRPFHGPRERPACIALQNEDHDEDAVVITALNVVPFCCHADLLTMPRIQLLEVAHTLNAKLPRLLQIDVAPARSDVFIRNSIEQLVGLRRNVPQAPKPVKSLRMHVSGAVPASPGSPLANKSRSHVSLGSPALAALQEEDESADSVERPQKRRRCDLDAEERPIASPRFDFVRPITRSQSHRVAPMYAGSPTKASMRVLRTRSQRLPERKPLLQGMHPNVTTTRGRAGSRGGGCRRSESTITTSTPKKQRVLGDANEVRLAWDGGLGSPAAVSPANSMEFALAFPHHLDLGLKGPAPRLKRKASEDSAHTADVTFGIDGMTMAAALSGSDMDTSVA